MSAKQRHILDPTSRESRCIAEKRIKKLGLSRPAKWLAIAFAWYHCESSLGGKQITLGLVLHFVRGFRDLCLFLRAFYGNRQPSFTEPPNVVPTNKTVAQMVRKLREWRTFTVVFNSKAVEVPLYTEVVDIELAKQMDIAIHYSSSVINFDFMIVSLRQVSNMPWLFVTFSYRSLQIMVLFDIEKYFFGEDSERLPECRERNLFDEDWARKFCIRHGFDKKGDFWTSTGVPGQNLPLTKDNVVILLKDVIEADTEDTIKLWYAGPTPWPQFYIDNEAILDNEQEQRIIVNQAANTLSQGTNDGTIETSSGGDDDGGDDDGDNNNISTDTNTINTTTNNDSSVSSFPYHEHNFIEHSIKFALEKTLEVVDSDSKLLTDLGDERYESLHKVLCELKRNDHDKVLLLIEVPHAESETQFAVNALFATMQCVGSKFKTMENVADPYSMHTTLNDSAQSSWRSWESNGKKCPSFTVKDVIEFAVDQHKVAVDVGFVDVCVDNSTQKTTLKTSSKQFRRHNKTEDNSVLIIRDRQTWLGTISIPRSSVKLSEDSAPSQPCSQPALLDAADVLLKFSKKRPRESSPATQVDDLSSETTCDQYLVNALTEFDRKAFETKYTHSATNFELRHKCKVVSLASFTLQGKTVQCLKNVPKLSFVVAAKSNNTPPESFWLIQPSPSKKPSVVNDGFLECAAIMLASVSLLNRAEASAFVPTFRNNGRLLIEKKSPEVILDVGLGVQQVSFIEFFRRNGQVVLKKNLEIINVKERCPTTSAEDMKSCVDFAHQYFDMWLSYPSKINADVVCFQTIALLHTVDVVVHFVDSSKEKITCRVASSRRTLEFVCNDEAKIKFVGIMRNDEILNGENEG